MNLYIMTRGRVGNLLTPKSIPKSWHSRTWIVCSYPELEEHKRDWPTMKVMCAPSSVTNYSQKFQYLINWINEHGGKDVIMDDDLWWDKQGEKPDGTRCLVKLDHVDELCVMWEDMENYLDEFPLVGIHPRMMGHQAPRPYKDVGKVITVQGINTHLFPTYPAMPKVDHDPFSPTYTSRAGCWLTGAPTDSSLTSW